jgi:signal transduction histidine kinase
MQLQEPIVSLDQEAWSCRYGDRSRAGELALQIIALADAGSAAEAVGRFHRASWALYAGHADLEPSLARAEQLFTQHGLPDELANCRDIRAQAALMAGDAAQGLALTRTTLAEATSERRPLARYITNNLKGLCEWDLGDLDAALRSFVMALHETERTGEAVLEANALGNLGGFQLDVFNADAALAHTARGMALMASAPHSTVWLTCAVNHMLALDALGKHADAAAQAQVLLAQEAHFPPGKRRSYHTKIAGVFMHAGEPDRARAHLARANSHGSADAPTTEWLAVTAELMHHEQRFRQARDLIETRALGASVGPYADVPQDLMQLYRVATNVCKAEGDFEAALRYQELAFARYEELMGRAARAKRIVIEIEQDVERTARQRDEALTRQRVAELEQLRLAEVNAALEQASQARSRFLAMASHDLRQPIHALALYLAALREDVDTPGPRELVVRASRTVDSLANMFEELLDLSRLEAGTVVAEPRPCSLYALVTRLAEEYRARAPEGLELVVHIPKHNKHEAGDALTDPLLAERILRNLIDNAVKYTGRGRVLLAIRRHEHNWRVEVRDNGPGIGEADCARIFEEFYQVSATETAQGLGLGLAIVHRLCRLLGHPIEVRSRLGVGSVFAVTIPRSERAAEAVAEVLPRGEASLNLVLIDDDAEVRDSMHMLLTRWGHRVAAAADTGELVLSQGFVPDAIVADLRLAAGRSGIDEIAHLRSRLGQHLPALVVTGESDAERLRAIQASGLPWLAKPVRPVRLRSWLAGVRTQ